MITLCITSFGSTLDDVADKLIQVAALLREGYTSGQGFFIEGELEPYDGTNAEEDEED